MRVRTRVLVVIVLAVLVLSLAQVTGLLDIVRDEGRLAQAVDDVGLWGPVLLILLMTALVPIGVPGVPFVLAAGVLWTWPIALAASLAGGMTSSTIGVLGARRIGREELQAKLPRWLEGIDTKLTSAGIWGVIALRIVLYLTAPADWVVGLSRVPTRTALLGTAVGLVPTTIGYVTVGPAFFQWLITPAGLTSAATGITVTYGVIRLRRARAATAAN